MLNHTTHLNYRDHPPSKISYWPSQVLAEYEARWEHLFPPIHLQEGRGKSKSRMRNTWSGTSSLGRNVIVTEVEGIHPWPDSLFGISKPTFDLHSPRIQVDASLPSVKEECRLTHTISGQLRTGHKHCGEQLLGWTARISASWVTPALDWGLDQGTGFQLLEGRRGGGSQFAD